MGDLLALQNEVASRLANAFSVGLISAKAARPIKHPDAVDYLLRGYAASNKPFTRGSRAEAISMYELAVALDPQLPS